MSFTDIQIPDWINKLPAPARPYAYLMRLDRPIGIWLLLLPGWWAILIAAGGVFSMGPGNWFVFLLFGLGAVIMRGAGCAINDLWDRHLDQKVARTTGRPLASGEIGTLDALIFITVLLAFGLAILLQLHPIAVLLGFLVLPLVVVYPLMKRITWWPQAFLGLTFNFSALMGWAAIVGFVGMPAIWLYISGIFWTLGYDTIYAHQDKEDDLLAGIKSTALKFGDQSKVWVKRFYLAALLCLAMAFITAGQSLFSLALLIPAAWHLSWQLQNWSPENPQSSLEIFKSNMVYGLLVLLAACF